MDICFYWPVSFPLSPFFHLFLLSFHVHLMPSALSFSPSLFFLLFSSTLALPKAMLWLDLPFGVVLFRGFYFTVYDLQRRRIQYSQRSQRGMEDWCGFCRASSTIHLQSVHIHFSVVFGSYKQMERELTHCNCRLTLYFSCFWPQLRNPPLQFPFADNEFTKEISLIKS